MACRYLGKAAFGEVLRSNAEIAREFGVTQYPTLLVICSGNKDVVVPYDGAAAARLLVRPPARQPACTPAHTCLLPTCARCSALRLLCAHVEGCAAVLSGVG